MLRFQMSNTLVDMQLESIKLKEDLDAANYKLTNKIGELEIALADAEEGKKRLTRMVASSNAKLEETEKKNKEIAARSALLETSNIELRNAYDKQVTPCN